MSQFKRRKKPVKSNKQIIMEAMVKDECKFRGIDIEPLNLTPEQIEELYKQLELTRLERIRRSCK